MRLNAFISISLVAFFVISCSTESTPVYQLTTSADPSEGGAITQSVPEAEEGESITITANPNENWIFDGWQGDLIGQQNPANVLMDRDKSITARFVLRQYPLTISIEGDGGVQEEIVQQRSIQYPHGTAVKLTATADEGWSFEGWSGDESSIDKEIIIEIIKPISITATFLRNEYKLNTTVEGEGTINSELKTGQQTDTGYLFGSIVELEGEPATGWRFTGWSGDLLSDINPVEVTINSNKEIEANFAQNVLSEVSALSESIVDFHSVRYAGSGRIYASTSEILINDNEDGIWLSEDDGYTWSKTYDTGAVFITGATEDPDLVIAGLVDGGYVMSQDGGKSWDSGRINDPFSNSITFTDASAVNKQNSIYLSTRHATRSGIFKSNNLGNSWNYIFSNSDAINTFGSLIEQIEVVSSNPNILYARTGFAHDIIKSTNGGSSFVSIKNGLPANITSLGMMRVNPDDVDQLFILNNISGNGGNSWTQQSINANNYFWYNGSLMQATSNSIRKSDDLGGSWQTVVSYGQELSGVSGTPTVEMASESIFLLYNGVPRYKISLDLLKD